MHPRGMNSPLQSPKKRRQLLLVGAMLLVMGGIIIVLFLHTDTSAPDLSASPWLNLKFSSFDQGLVGSGGTKSETRKLDTYSAIESDGAIDIKWSPGPTPSAVVETDANLVPHVKTEVVGGTLKIYTDGNISSSGAMTVTLTGPPPTRVELSGSGDFTATSLEGDTLDITAAGSSDIKLSGKLRKLTVDLSGSGDVDAINLKTESTKLTIAGSGDAKVDATDTLDATIMGSGSVTYRGKPAHLTQDIAGSGSINPE